MSEPIDFIDLTVDSPANRAFRAANGRRKAKTGKRLIRNELPQDLEGTIVLNTTILEDDNRNPTDKNIVEIIDLDETLVAEKTTPCVVDDSVQTNLIPLTCPICLEQLSSAMKPTSTRCGHIFCAQCLKQSIKAAQKCPTCKATVKLKMCTRLYF